MKLCRRSCDGCSHRLLQLALSSACVLLSSVMCPLTYPAILSADGTEGGHHGTRLLQRLSAPGDEGRRHHLRPERAAHHQRADGGGDRVRPRQEGRRRAQRAHLRPRRRHVRRVDPHDRGRHLQGEVDGWRHASRRRGLRYPHGEPLHAGTVPPRLRSRFRRRPDPRAKAVVCLLCPFLIWYWRRLSVIEMPETFFLYAAVFLMTGSWWGPANRIRQV